MKVYTAFLFKGYPNPDTLHCTHKYIGEVDSWMLSVISEIISNYFDKPRVAPSIVFEQEAFFGEDNDVRVLIPKEYNKKDFHPHLRSALECFRKDDFDYRPHVTTTFDKVDFPIVSYDLIVDGKIQKSFLFEKPAIRNSGIRGVLELRPIKESTEDYDEIEKRISALLRKEIYVPLIREFSESASILKNEKNALITAIHSGRITFNRGTFSGRFNAAISKEIKTLGGVWSRVEQVWKIPIAQLPMEVQNAISASAANYQRKIESIDKKLSQIVPEELADKLKVEKLFDSTIWKVDREFNATVKGITVAPKLSKEHAARVSSEWQTNMKLWIKDFTEKEILKLRKDMRETIESGNRYGSAIDKIKASYGVTRRKAKFLARQETSLLMAKFKQVRYQDAGVNEYRWGCVAGTPAHPVRPWHKALEGKVFRWDDPPVTTKPGEAQRKNNPGQDYNCRCFARPIVRFR
jgi:SPP1 gp7 family putative phage head morphogenesis protein